MADPLRDAQAFFAPRAEAYRTSRSHGNPAELRRMIDWLAPAPGTRALDVATGGGQTAFALQDAGCRVVATDATRAMLAGLARTAAERGGAAPEAAAADAQALPFRDASFDVVASRIAPHHFPDLPRFVREARRVLRPGGRLYVFDLTTPEDDEAAKVINRIETLRDPSHLDSHRPSRWRSALAAAGLATERFETTASDFELEPWIARARMTLEADAELRRILLEQPAATLGGYGVTAEGKMRVLRVEILARA